MNRVNATRGGATRTLVTVTAWWMSLAIGWAAARAVGWPGPVGLAWLLIPVGHVFVTLAAAAATRTPGIAPAARRFWRHITLAVILFTFASAATTGPARTAPARPSRSVSSARRSCSW